MVSEKDMAPVRVSLKRLRDFYCIHKYEDGICGYKTVIGRDFR